MGRDRPRAQPGHPLLKLRLSQLTWYLTPHSRTGAFADNRRGGATGGPLARGATKPQDRRAVRLTSRTSHDRPDAHARTYVDPFALVWHGLGTAAGARPQGQANALATFGSQRIG